MKSQEKIGAGMEMPERLRKEIEVIIENLEGPAENILYQIRKGVDRGEYRLLIGDDASGRIPALIFRSALKKIYEEKGFEPPKTLFFAGSGPIVESSAGNDWAENNKEREIRSKDRSAKSELISDYLKHVGADKLVGGSEKALLITDTIVSGGSIKPVADALKNMGIPFEIVTVGLVVPPTDENINKPISERQAELENLLGAKIIYGSKYTPDIYSRRSLGGVFKNPADVFSEPSYRDISGGGDPGIMIMKLAREKAEALGEQLALDYLHETPG